MRNPFWRLKTIPWITLLQAAGLVVAMATAADILLVVLWGLLLSSNVGRLEPLLNLLLLLLPLAAGFGMGALTIVVMERLFRRVYLDTGVLWALIPCIALVLVLKVAVLPIPTFVVAMGYPQMIGVILGVFLTGRRYW